MVLLKLTFVLLCTPFLSPLLQFAVRTLWLQCETYVSAVQTGGILTLFFARNNGSQTFEELKVKQSVMIHPLLYQ